MSSYISTSDMTSEEAYSTLLDVLGDLPTGTLAAMATALEVEKYVCTGMWIAANGEEKPSGCLLAATFLQTPAFEEWADGFGSISDAVMALDSEIDDSDGAVLRDELGLSKTEMSNVINRFDTWGGQISERIEYTSHAHGFKGSFDALPAAQKDTLRADILSILAARS